MDIRPEAKDPSNLLPLPARPPLISVNPHHQIRIRHPHYPFSSNLLFTLFAPDSPNGGIEYGVVHAACGVVCGNRWNGWFTSNEGATLTLTYGDILYDRDCYFHLPDSSFDNPYAIVPNFREWTFPHDNLHPCWHKNEDHVPLAHSRFAAPSSLSAAVFSRDQSCRMSAFAEGTQVAHLCPRSEEDWFKRNEMSRYNLNPLLVATRPMEDTANALLLRQDLHTHFDAHKFVFVPKKNYERIDFVTHMLIASRELGYLNHNVCLKPIPDVEVAFLFARFAKSIFTLLTGFLEVGVERTLIGITVSTTPGMPLALSAADCKKLVLCPKSCSQSPTMRARNCTVDVGEDVADSRRCYKRKREDDTVEVDTKSSQSTEAFKDTITKTGLRDVSVLREIWIQKERLRSDPENTWLKEKDWARYIRNDERVMGPEESQRLSEFMGYEQRDWELDEDTAP